MKAFKLSEAVRKLDSLGFNVISDEPDTTYGVVSAVLGLAAVGYQSRDRGDGDREFNPAPRTDLPTIKAGMTFDQTAWLNQGREELKRAVARIDHATSSRRADDLQHALAVLRRVREHIEWADECLKRMKSGLPYEQRRPS